MKMTKLARFFRFCGYGVATTSFLIGAAAVLSLPYFEPDFPLWIGFAASLILFVFAVAWIIMSYDLEKEAIKNDKEYKTAVTEIERFREESRAWYAKHVPSAEITRVVEA